MLTGARIVKELGGQSIGWMVFMDVEVSNDDCRSSNGGIRLPSAGHPQLRGVTRTLVEREESDFQVLKSSMTEESDLEVGRNIGVRLPGAKIIHD